jgi:hypothetical protein
MVRLDRAGEEHIRDLLNDTELARDQLPYSDEFVRLKADFYKRTFKDISDSEFWIAVARVGKRGGVRGKHTRDHAPELTEAQQQSLENLLPVALGETDSLPYTPKMSGLVVRFNKATGMKLTEREAWLAILHMRK